MVKKTVITELPDYDDDVIVFPQNRTLYVDQFTDEAPDSDEKREVFSPKYMKDVFYRYRPQKEIELETIDGEIVNEYFCFNSIADFEDNQLIEHSELLCRQKANNQAQDVFRKNLCHVHKQISDLEITYRTLDAFFANAGHGEVDCLTLMNVNKEKLKIHDSDDTLAVIDELEKYYDRLNLKNNYSLLVIPGYFDDIDIVRKWATIAYRNKVILVTDYKDCPDYESLADSLNTSCLQGQDVCLTHVIMTCNYLLGREKSKSAGEKDNLYIPASGALAGRMANTEEIVISQGAAGMKYGKLKNVKGTRFNLLKDELKVLMDQGVIPMIEVDGRIMAFSNCSLYNGALTFLQEYPVVRELDWICKVLINFLNSQSFLNWNLTVRTELREWITDFLNDYSSKLIGSYNIKKLDKDPTTNDIRLVIELKPFLSTTIVLELIGHDGEYDDNIYHKTNN